MNKKVKAPAGYHWKFKAHRGASVMADFKVQMKHASPKKKRGR